ncbi:MAG: hypothetical protein K1W24_15495 [Lachnospiraceae bacterium]
MPKILQRTLLTLITKYSIYILLYYLVYIITCIITGNKHNFLEEKDIMIFMFIIFLEFFDTSIPDYIFIAPFSKEERIGLQKKLFLYSHFIIWIIISAFISLPGLITAAINGNLQNIFKYIFEIAVIYPMIFTAGHFRYFNMLNKNHFTFTIVSIDTFILIGSSVTAAIMMENTIGMPDYILMAVIGVLAIFVSLYCCKKHFKNMLEFYSDYETRTEQKV